MYICQGRFCVLKELTTTNDKELFRLMLRHQDEYEKKVSGESVLNTYETFSRKLNEWFSNGRRRQFLVYNLEMSLVGTIFFYGWNREVQTIKISCFFVPATRRRVLVAEALGLALDFAAHILGVNTVMFDVYTDNIEMHNLARKLGAGEENVFRSLVDLDRLIICYSIPGGIIDVLLRKLAKLKGRH